MIMALLRLTRPWYSLPLSCGLLVIILYVSGGDFRGPGIGFVCAFLSLYLMLSAAYVQNDVCDAKVDAVNNPDKVIPQGLVSLKLASFVHVLLLSLGLMLSLFCGLKYFGVLFITAMGLMVYNFYSKRLGIFKDILAAALTTRCIAGLCCADPVIRLLIHFHLSCVAVPAAVVSRDAQGYSRY
jgi:4-hydroxybenzoate polyprenyltransferase